MKFGIIGSGSWATALAKILTDKEHQINWWVRNPDTLRHIAANGFNPRYLSNAKFNTKLLNVSGSIQDVVAGSETIVVAIPSAFAEESLSVLQPGDWKNKKVISAIKGLLPGKNILLNFYLEQEFDFSLQD